MGPEGFCEGLSRSWARANCGFEKFKKHSMELVRSSTESPADELIGWISETREPSELDALRSKGSKIDLTTRDIRGAGFEREAADPDWIQVDLAARGGNLKRVPFTPRIG